jgi:hypothetical protein
MDKPRILYHGSWNKDIDEFQPQVAQSDPEPRVYASHDYFTALLFLPKYNGWMSVGEYEVLGRKSYYILFTENKKSVYANDKGGAVYGLPSDSFVKNPEVNGGEWEWYSKVSVKPIQKDIYGSWIEEFTKRGIKIFFIEHDKFQDFQKLEPEKKAEFLKQKEKDE